MPKFVRYSWALCDRCNRKFRHSDLRPDPNAPGLMVCKKDLDGLDPWKLPPRAEDNIVLPFVRADTKLEV